MNPIQEVTSTEMPTKVIVAHKLLQESERTAKRLAAEIEANLIAARLLGQREFSESVVVYAYEGSLAVIVHTREDLETALSLKEGKWEKTVDHYMGGFEYAARVGDIFVRITACDAAVPPTCRVIEEEYVIEAQPARIGKRRRVECGKATEAPIENEVKS